MTQDNTDTRDDAQMLAIYALEEALTTLKRYPEALKAYLEAEKKALRESRWVPDLIQSLLFTLKAQKAILDRIKISQENFRIIEEAERIALDATKTVLRVAKAYPEELKTFLNAKSMFDHAYIDLLENPVDNISALCDYITAEINILEHKGLNEAAIKNAHDAVIKAIKTSLTSLENYPEALTAFLESEKKVLEIKSSNELAQTLLESHLLLLKGQDTLLNLYREHPFAYQAFTNMAISALQNRKDTYEQLKDGPAKKMLQDSLTEFEKIYFQFIGNPAANLESFRKFLTNEIHELEAINVYEPELMEMLS